MNLQKITGSFQWFYDGPESTIAIDHEISIGTGRTRKRGGGGQDRHDIGIENLDKLSPAWYSTSWSCIPVIILRSNWLNPSNRRKVRPRGSDTEENWSRGSGEENDTISCRDDHKQINQKRPTDHWFMWAKRFLKKVFSCNLVSVIVKKH